MTHLIRKSLLILIYSFTSIAASAQAKIVFDAPKNHVGELLFQQPKNIVFDFTNKGTEALEIIDVRPSCGCTEAAWTKGPIAPGERGCITAIYDAKMLGSFYKELAVYTTMSAEPIYVSMEGRVVTKKIDYEGDFPIDLGGIRISTNYIEFDDVNRGDRPVAELMVFNQQRTPYRPELMHLPPYLTMEAFPQVIAGGHTGRIRLTLDSEKLGLLGLNQTRIFLARYMGDKVSESNEILVSAVLLPAFQDLTAAQLATAPTLQLSSDEIDFPPLNGKKSLRQTITITNTGKQMLNIRSVQVFNQAISVSLGNRNIEPGKSTQMKIELSAKYLKKARNRPRVLLITNDPQNAKKTININVNN